MQQLSVVNLMLDTMGELPLNSLTDSHAMLPTALAKLDEWNRSVQSQGWWFNMEELTLTPSNIDNAIYLPNDCMEVRQVDRNVVKRGARLYNLNGGTYEFTSALDLELIREVPFDDIPEVAASYISKMAILAFQTSFDADSQKMAILKTQAQLALIDINSAHTRNRKSNFLNSNSRLALLKYVTQGARRNIGR